jgi:hypothetical protein
MLVLKCLYTNSIPAAKASNYQNPHINYAPQLAGVPLNQPGRNEAGEPLKIGIKDWGRPLRFIEHFNDSLRLVKSDLKKQMTAAHQKFRSLVDDPPYYRKTIGTVGQGDVRLEVTHLGLKPCNVLYRHIRRI